MDSTSIRNIVFAMALVCLSAANAWGVSYPVVDTNQSQCYSIDNVVVSCFSAIQGQDASYTGRQPSYQDNGDGTITDLVTGLMWQQTPDLDTKSTYAEAVANASAQTTGGYTDWRLPTIKELYSLIDFTGSSFSYIPYIDTDYFDFEYGDTSKGERTIDAQYWSSTSYVGKVFTNTDAAFGVNFADGRIKGYPISKTSFVRYVRGNTSYGQNSFVDNGDGTVTDNATGLMWMQSGSSGTGTWEEALNWAENLEYAGYTDWRLPNAKELQSLVDYTRAPDASDTLQQGPAIDPVFDVATEESWYWTSTSFLDSHSGAAVYIAFGQAFGIYSGEQINVHGAGAQRSDPKYGDPSDYSAGFGPQNDEVRIYNYGRCVRDAEAVSSDDSGPRTYTAPLMTPGVFAVFGVVLGMVGVVLRRRG